MTGIPSVAHNKCHAKVYVNQAGKAVAGLSVFDHTLLVGLIAREIIKQLPFKFYSYFPHGSELIAACHDVGKVSPSFYLKLNQIIDTDHQITGGFLSRFVKNANEIDKSIGGHSSVSAITLRSINQESAAIIAGSHHGYLNPKSVTHFPYDDVLGGANWHSERLKLIEALKVALDCNFPEENLTKIQLEILCGLTCVADWIGSGDHFKEMDKIDLYSTRECIRVALNDAGLDRFEINKNLSFKDIFGFSPNNLQKSCITQGVNQSIYVIEAPMGDGKTEAALYMAYQCLLRNDARGIYFALPTQITSNKMYERFKSFLSAITDLKRFPKLLHSNAQLSKSMYGGDAEPGKDWFDGAKRGLLAPFAIGTLDQALMSIVNVKHHFVRSFGLMGKVVILDEVHSYDMYTGTLLDELVQHLVDLKCTVIILSATLSHERKQKLLKISEDKHARRYPCLTQLDENKNLKQIETSQAKSIKTLVKSSCDTDCFAEAIQRASQGQYVLWIENSVKDAIASYKSLKTLLPKGVSIQLTHSRFTQYDKSVIEDEWSNRYGKKAKRSSNGFIWVGTQILEQSLDIDADFLVCRFAPSDFNLQRLGRLWRHNRADRNPTASREAWLICPTLQDALGNIELFGATRYVYGAFPMLKSLKAWEPVFNKGCINLPSDIPDIISNTYEADTAFDASIDNFKKEFEIGTKNQAGTQKLQAAAQNALASIGKPCLPDRVATRYIEVDQVTLYLFKKIEVKEQFILFTLMNNEIFVLNLSDINTKNNALKMFLVEAKRHSTNCPHYFVDQSNSQNSDMPKLLKTVHKLLDQDSVICIVQGDKVQPIDQLPYSQCNLRYCSNLGLYMDKGE